MARDVRATGPATGQHGGQYATLGNSEGVRASRPLEDESAPGLLGRLIEDVTSLFRNELALARAETMEAAHKAKAGVGAVATGGAVALLGGVALVVAAILGLATVMVAWLAALIVGAVLVVVGYAMVSSGKKRLEPSNLTLDRTRESLRRDKETVTEPIRRRNHE
jgi:hypothetical protein